MVFPQEPLPVKVALDLQGDVGTFGADITNFVRISDGIQITRGRADEASQTAPQTCTMTVDNRDGRFSPRNPTSVYYGRLVRNAQIRVSVAVDVEYDATSQSSAGTGNLSWTHTPTSDAPRAVVVWVITTGSTSDQVSGVTYGGLAMTRAAGLATTPGGFYERYELDEGLPAGPQTVLVTVTGAATKQACAITLAGGDAVQLGGIPLTPTAGTSANPSTTLSTLLLGPGGAARDALFLGVLHSGQDAISGVAPGAGYTQVFEGDLGNDVMSVIRSNGLVSSGGAINWVATSETWTINAIAAVAWSYRFVGEVSEWPPRWDLSENDAFVPITASGIMRRLGQGRPPTRSGFRAYILAQEPNNYWPLDEGELAGYGRNASSVSSFRFFPYPSSGVWKPAFKFGTGELSGLPNGLQITRTNSGGFTFPYFRGDLAISSTLVAIDFVYQAVELGTVTVFGVDYNDNTWRLALRSGALDDVAIAHVQESTGTVTALADTGVLGAITDGELHHVRFQYEQNGADVDLEAFVDGVSVLTTTRAATTMDGAAVVRLTYQPTGTETPLALGHVVVWRDIAPPDAADLTLAMLGFAGETAGQRMDRIAAEQSVGLTIVGDPDTTTPMGPQIEGDLLTQLRDAAAADLGSLYELRDTLGLVYRTREDIYNQTSTVTIDYSAGELSPPLEPTDDDQLTRNDVTATRKDGGSVRQTRTTGALSTAEPPEGVGPYPDEVTVNVERDDQLSDVAGWLLHLGTWDEARYPTVVVDRATPDVAANPTLSAALLDLDIDDQVVITGMESQNIYDDVGLLVRGYRETLGAFSHAFEFNCSPAGPYDTGIWNDDVATTGSRYSPDAIRTWEALDTTETAIEVLIDAGDTAGGLFSDADAPFDIAIGGERMTVTAVDNEAISFVGVGAGDSDNNANVQAGLPAGTAVGDLVLIFASIRNSGTGTPNTPTNWSLLLDMSNARVYGRIYDGVWTMPVISFSNGALNADTIAQSCAFRGLSVGDFPSVQLNASAQNIATPAVGSSQAGVAIWCGWKQDDWSSVAVHDYPGATLINARLGTLGSDAAQVWNYKILDPGEALPAGTFVVTGGASAISRGGVLLLWAGQTLTVTRSVNGVVKTHSAGDSVQLFEPARYAL